MAAGALFSLMGLCVKTASAHVDAGQIVWWRNLVQLVGVWALARSRGVPLWPVVDRRALLLRSVLGTFAMVCYFAAISRLPLGDAVLLTYTMPLFVAWLSPAVTGESRAPGLVPALLVGLMGVALVADPRFSPDLLGVALGLAASALSGTAYVWLRVATRSDARERIVFWFAAACVLLTTPSWVSGPPPWTWDGIGALVGAGLIGLVATLLLTRAYEEGPADVVALFGYSTPVFAYLVGAAAFGDRVTWQAMAGVALVVASGLIVRRRGS